MRLLVMNEMIWYKKESLNNFDYLKTVQLSHSDFDRENFEKILYLYKFTKNGIKNLPKME